MSQSLNASSQKVQDTLRTLGFPFPVVEMPQTTRSAAEAAEAIGCRVEQIAKALIFKAQQTEKPVLVIASGVNRVKEKKVATILGEALDKADADFVRQRTGFVIGGVLPVGHNAIIFSWSSLLARAVHRKHPQTTTPFVLPHKIANCSESVASMMGR